jgi:hypothetical protein
MTAARRLLTRLAAAAALLAGLAGCSSDKAVTVLTCPQVYLVQDASHYADYAPGGRDLIDVRFDAKITQVQWTCTFMTDQNRVDMEVRFALRALMGPAATSKQARFPYFVAVADPSGAILAKQVFGIDLAFPGNSIEIGHVESVFQKIGYASLSTASKYTVYIGFQLTPEQLAAARAKSGQP